MGYTSERERLSDRIDTVVSGLKDLNSAMDARQENVEGWQDYHLHELEVIQIDMMRLKNKLLSLQSNNS